MIKMEEAIKRIERAIKFYNEEFADYVKEARESEGFDRTNAQYLANRSNHIAKGLEQALKIIGECK